MAALAVLTMAVVIGATVGSGPFARLSSSSQPEQDYATVETVSVILEYAPGVVHSLSVGPDGGCSYENCPVEWTWPRSADGAGFNLSEQLNILLLNNGSGLPNMSASLVRVSSFPTGVTGSSMLFVVFLPYQVLQWAPVSVMVPPVHVTYSVVTVTISVS